MDFTYLIGLAGIFLAAYILYGAIHRLYLSPVASFPGPKLAALTFWYEFYYDVLQGGRYTWRIAQLHEQYGPIIRINPYELHVIDPDFYDELYVGTSKRKTNKWSWTVPMFATPDSIVATTGHDTHRSRRAAFSNYFSKQSIGNYSEVIQVSVDKLCSRLREHQASGRVVNLVHAYAALAGDVVTGYSFSEDYGLLDRPDFAPEFFELFQSILSSAHSLKQFPWLFPFMLSLPEWLAETLLPDLAAMSHWQRKWVEQIEEAKAETGAWKAGVARPGIFRTLLDSALPPHDKTATRLMHDAQTLVGAGTETTSRTLAVATYYILADVTVFKTLMKELAVALPDQTVTPVLAELEQLPYLTAIIYETLRMSHGVCHRLQRVSPHQDLYYHDWLIPAGTPVSMTALHVHGNFDIFPEPHQFKPERWLPLETQGRRLSRYLVAFSKGSRQCLGLNLAYAELYMTLAAVFTRFGNRMEMVDTIKERDVDVARDIIVPAPKRESKGIFMKIAGNGSREL